MGVIGVIGIIGVIGRNHITLITLIAPIILTPLPPATPATTPRSSLRNPVNAVLKWFLAGEIAKMNKLSAEDFGAVKSLYFSKKNSSQKENKKNITLNEEFA